MAVEDEGVECRVEQQVALIICQEERAGDSSVPCVDSLKVSLTDGPKVPGRAK